jgi:hypothetical protein
MCRKTLDAMSYHGATTNRLILFRAVEAGSLAPTGCDYNCLCRGGTGRRIGHWRSSSASITCLPVALTVRAA